MLALQPKAPSLKDILSMMERMVPSPSKRVFPTAWTTRNLPEESALRIVNWPLRERNPMAWGACLFALCVVGFVAACGSGTLITLITAFSLAVALWRSYLPVRWEIGLAGITQVVLGWKKRIPWIAIAKYEPHEDGVWLFADRSGSPLRGVFITYDGQRDVILQRIEYYLGTWTSSGESTTTMLHPPSQSSP
jgi:hypothetical protein